MGRLRREYECTSVELRAELGGLVRMIVLGSRVVEGRVMDLSFDIPDVKRWHNRFSELKLRFADLNPSFLPRQTDPLAMDALLKELYEDREAGSK